MDDTPPAGPGSPRRATLAAVGVVALAWTLAACPLGDPVPIENAAQARAVAVARTMASGGGLVVPSYRGEPRLKKPPLQSWAQAAAMAVSGSRSPEAAGWASFVVGILWALTPFLLGAALGRPAAGLLGSLALCSTRAATQWGWSPEHDVVFGGFVGLAWAFLARATSPHGRARDSWIAGLATAAALLVKGPFALAFVGLAAVVEAVRRRRDPGAGRVRWVPFALAALVPPLAWLALVASDVGGIAPAFDEMRRQALGEGGAHARSPLFYFEVVPTWSLLWTVPALAAAALRWRLAPPRRTASLGFAGTLALIGFVTLTVVPAKQDHYVLPVLPAFFLLAGGWFEDALDRAGPRLRAFAPWIAIAMGAGIAVNRLHGARANGFLLPTPAFVATTALALGAVALARRGVGGVARPFLLGLVGAAALAGWGAHAERVRALDAEDLRETAPVLARIAGPSRTLVGLSPGAGEAFDALDAWLETPVVRLRDATLVQNWLDASAPFALVVAERHRALLAPYGDALREAGTASPPRAKDEKDRYAVFVRAGP